MQEDYCSKSFNFYQLNPNCCDFSYIRKKAKFVYLSKKQCLPFREIKKKVIYPYFSFL